MCLYLSFKLLPISIILVQINIIINTLLTKQIMTRTRLFNNAVLAEKQNTIEIPEISSSSKFNKLGNNFDKSKISMKPSN